MEEPEDEYERQVEDRLERFDAMVEDGSIDSYPSLREQLRGYFDRAGL